MAEKELKKISYRPDIDGLRAISISSVLAFHAGLPFVSGGFVGVDVFFVISGYLISRLLLTEFESHGKITLLDFWARRVRRLAPALLLVVASTLLGAVFFLDRISGEVGALAKSAMATLFINANHFFWRESGNYFGASAETNPFLHMWSLSVEEQFYVLWPFVLLYCLRYFGIQRTKYFAYLVFVASFVLSCYWTAVDSSKAFYFMPSRAWQLMAGAMLAFMSLEFRPVGQVAATLMGAAGLVAIAISIVALSGDAMFPGPAALLPTLGAMLVLGGGGTGRSTFVTRSLSLKPIVYLGKISYPLYLWHWPILVVMRSNRLYQESLGWDLFGLAIAVVLAMLTHEFVEKGIWWRLQNRSSKRVVISGAIGSGALVCLALLIGAWARFGWGYSQEELRLDASRRDMPELDCMFSTGVPTAAQIDACIKPSKKPTVLLWGDSHANHWRPSVAVAANKSGLNPAVLTMNACRPLPGPVGSDTCIAFNNLVIEKLPDWVESRGLVGLVLSARWPEGTGTQATSIVDRKSWRPGEFFDRRAKSQYEALGYLEKELREVFAAARDHRLRVLLVMPSPVQKFAAAHCLSVLPASECQVTESDLTRYVSPAENVIRSVVAEFDMVRLFEPREFMCHKGVCPMVIDGTIVYTDDDHISKSYSILKASEFESGLAWLAQNQPITLEQHRN